MVMPTTLLPRRDQTPESPEPADLEFRNLICAAAMLLAVLGLVCEKYYPSTPGYSLAESPNDIQLSP
jgi:hypothetical protein